MLRRGCKTIAWTSAALRHNNPSPQPQAPQQIQREAGANGHHAHHDQERIVGIGASCCVLTAVGSDSPLNADVMFNVEFLPYRDDPGLTSYTNTVILEEPVRAANH